MKDKLAFSSLLLLVLFLTLPPTILASTTWYVNGVSGRDSNNCKSSQTACKTIGHAISLASSGDSIMVFAATYQENLTIGISLKVIGAGARTTIIDGQQAGRVITIFSANAQITLSNITIRNGSSGSGAGIDNENGSLTINNSTISGNASFVPLYCCAFGAGIYNGGALTINNTTISGNTTGCGRVFCGTVGAGIYNDGKVVINNSTIVGNIAYGFRTKGGGIYNAYQANAVLINNSTLNGNWALDGGGIYGSASFQNSIVAGNSGNCSRTQNSYGYNMSSDSTCNFGNIGDQNNTNPMLGTLGNYGGPTQTIPLLPGSPAIDAGNPSGCTDDKGNLLKTDQRGARRPDKEDSGGCDMGAFERQTD